MRVSRTSTDDFADGAPIGGSVYISGPARTGTRRICMATAVETEVYTIVAEPLTPEAYAPFGTVLSAEGRAFIIPGGVGAQIHRGTWHEPPFPIIDKSYALITSHQALTKGLGLALNERGEIGGLDVDKRSITERTGKILRVALP